MKTFLISSTIFVFVIILIIIFQNIANSMTGVWILLIQFDQQTSASLGIIVLTVFGFVAGVLSTALAMSLVNEGKNQEEAGGANW